MIRVLIADDHTILRHGLRQLIELADDITVVGEAASGQQCLEAVKTLKPDVVLLDITMPDITGIEVSRRIKTEWPGIGIVILTIHDAEDYLLEAVRVGVEGYVLKDADPSQLFEAIRASHAGRSFLQPALASRLMSGMRRYEQASRTAERIEDILTQREIEVLQLMAEGATNKEISRRLFISEKTVKNHTNNIFRKMGVSDRTQAVLDAIRKGWVDVHSRR